MLDLALFTQLVAALPGVLVLSLAAILVLALLVFLSAIKIVPEYERGVVFRLGWLIGPRGPGLFFLIPIVERMVRVDTRVITLDVPAQAAR